jgi:hypothetical protein
MELYFMGDPISKLIPVLHSGMKKDIVRTWHNVETDSSESILRLKAYYPESRGVRLA